eukprot:TRINITY_DN39512_c0_g1_i1.p1 TRINITY_DN39512_c0_g1~~TRINITY_DN39512_c0_g1_i1.p1  ORF type:complete len:584 (+),score=168.17 TRINITY_DN39512_c0_g1_i1:140-1753(+)
MARAGVSADFAVPAHGDWDLPDGLVARLRCVCMTDTELYFWDPAAGPPQREISSWNELKAIKMLRSLAAEQFGKETPQRRRVEAAAKSWSAKFANSGRRQTPERVVLTGREWERADEPLVALRRSMLQAGAEAPRVCPCLCPDTTGRGLAFSEDLVYPAPVAAVPLSMLVTADAARSSDLGPALASVGESPAVDDGTALLLFIVRGRFDPAAASDAGGRWRSYFQMLPARFSSPLFWDFQDLAELQGSSLIEEVMEAKEQVRQCRESLFATRGHLLDADIYSFDNMLWARGVTDSRAFVLNIGGRTVTCLSPCADLINHTGGPGSVSYRRFDDASQTFLLESLSDCPAGEQALMNYGPLSNGELLMQYGFVLEGNPLEVCQVGVEISDEEDFYQQKVDAHRRLGIPEDHFLAASSESDAEPGRPSRHLLLAIAIAASVSEEDVAAVVDGADTVGGGFSSLPVDLRIRSCELLVQLAEYLLSEFPTSLEEDLEDLERVQHSGEHTEILATPNTVMALLYRIGQKQILRSTLRWVARVS